MFSKIGEYLKPFISPTKETPPAYAPAASRKAGDDDNNQKKEQNDSPRRETAEETDIALISPAAIRALLLDAQKQAQSAEESAAIGQLLSIVDRLEKLGVPGVSLRPDQSVPEALLAAREQYNIEIKK